MPLRAAAATAATLDTVGRRELEENIEKNRVGKTTTEETEAKAERCLETRFSRVWPTGWASQKGKRVKQGNGGGELNFNLVPCRTKRSDAQQVSKGRRTKLNQKRGRDALICNSWKIL